MINCKSDAIYICKRNVAGDDYWANTNFVRLSDVVTGGAVHEETAVKACWDSYALHIRFECEDSYCISDFKNRNDPLFEQDVVEVFIDDAGDGRQYAEIVVSPHNVVFDAWIIHDNEEDPLAFTINHDWETEGLITSVRSVNNKMYYTITIPFSNFKHRPVQGSAWKINFFRIDNDRSGTRHYQAWSSTGIVNFHVPASFGTLRFE